MSGIGDFFSGFLQGMGGSTQEALKEKSKNELEKRRLDQQQSQFSQSLGLQQQQLEESKRQNIALEALQGRRVGVEEAASNREGEKHNVFMAREGSDQATSDWLLRSRAQAENETAQAAMARFNKEHMEEDKVFQREMRTMDLYSKRTSNALTNEQLLALNQQRIHTQEEYTSMNDLRNIKRRLAESQANDELAMQKALGGQGAVDTALLERRMATAKSKLGLLEVMYKWRKDARDAGIDMSKVDATRTNIFMDAGVNLLKNMPTADPDMVSDALARMYVATSALDANPRGAKDLVASSPGFVDKYDKALEALMSPGAMPPEEAINRMMGFATETIDSLPKRTSPVPAESQPAEGGGEGGTAQGDVKARMRDALAKAGFAGKSGGGPATPPRQAASIRDISAAGIPEDVAKTLADQTGEYTHKIFGKDTLTDNDSLPADLQKYGVAFDKDAASSQQETNQNYAKYLLKFKRKASEGEFNNYKKWFVENAKYYAEHSSYSDLLQRGDISPARAYDLAKGQVIQSLSEKGQPLIEPKDGPTGFNAQDRDARPGAGWAWRDNSSGKTYSTPPI